MKRIISIMLCVLMLFIAGCDTNDTAIRLDFFYPRVEYGYNTLESHFFTESATFETRDDITYVSARQVIGEYLKGPVDPSLTNPFPDGTSLVSLSIDGNTLYLTLSDHLSELTGIHLVMACSCLAKTGMKLTRTTEAVIRCDSAQLDGKSAIKLTDSMVIFDDTAVKEDSY